MEHELDKKMKGKEEIVTEVTEETRELIKAKIAEFEPDWMWNLIPREERESLEQAYLRTDDNQESEVLSDNKVMDMIRYRANELAEKVKITRMWLHDVKTLLKLDHPVGGCRR